MISSGEVVNGVPLIFVDAQVPLTNWCAWRAPRHPFSIFGVNHISSQLAVELPIEVPRDTIFAKSLAVTSVQSLDIARSHLRVCFFDNLASPIEFNKCGGRQGEQTIVGLSGLSTSADEIVVQVLLKKLRDLIVTHGIRFLFCIGTEHIPCLVNR